MFDDAGRMKPSAYRWSVDVTVYISPEAHRSAVGRTLYDVLLPTLKRQGFHAAYAGIALPNNGSVGLPEALGFAHIGTYSEGDLSMVRGMMLDIGVSRWIQRIRQNCPCLSVRSVSSEWGSTSNIKCAWPFKKQIPQPAETASLQPGEFQRCWSASIVGFYPRSVLSAWLANAPFYLRHRRMPRPWP